MVTHHDLPAKPDVPRQADLQKRHGDEHVSPYPLPTYYDMNTPLKVEFDDTAENWLRWGELVRLWASGQHRRPEDTQNLVKQLTAHGITNSSVAGLARDGSKKIFLGGEGDFMQVEESSSSAVDPEAAAMFDLQLEIDQSLEAIDRHGDRIDSLLAQIERVRAGDREHLTASHNGEYQIGSAGV